MAGKHFRKSPKFSIEDAFEEDVDDAIRIYGATNERSPLRPSAEIINKEAETEVEVKVEDPCSFHERPANNRTFSFLNRHDHRGFLPVSTEPDTASRDSDSLIPGDNYYNRTSTSTWWFLHPKIKENWRIVTGAFILFFLGTTLLITGIVIEAVPIDSLSGFVFLIAGFICFIPGAYHVAYIVLAVQGREGYDFYSLPLFN